MNFFIYSENISPARYPTTTEYKNINSNKTRRHDDGMLTVALCVDFFMFWHFFY